MKDMQWGRAVAFIIWIVILVAGAMLNARLHPPSPPLTNVWQAAKDLPKNHQVQKDDLMPAAHIPSDAPQPSFDGYLDKYLTTSIAKDTPLTTDTLTDFPSITIDDQDYVVYTYPLIGEEAYLAKALDVTNSVQLCAVFLEKPEEARQGNLQTDCLAESLEVVAVYEGDGEALSSWLALKVPKMRVNELGQFAAADKRFLLVAN